VLTLGGTLGEQLVWGGAVTDDALTDFYKQRLLVPQVNPNTLARLPSKVIAQIPSAMAIELRAIPVAMDADNNLTVAMSDPSDRHAVDEIAQLTGAYVVRAVATQMQIAWCLAHYYGHVTALGKKLLQPSSEKPASERAVKAAVKPPTTPPRTKGQTGQVQAMRHRAIAPGGDVTAPRPSTPPANVPVAAPPPVAVAPATPPRVRAVTPPPVPVAARAATPTPAAAATPTPAPAATPTPPPAPATAAPAPPPAAPPATDLDVTPPTGSAKNAPAADGKPDGEQPRARSISGEIRLPLPRAQSIKPMTSLDDNPYADDDDQEMEIVDDSAIVRDSPPETSGPIISIEADEPTDEPTGPSRPAPARRRRVKSDPPELAARAGEVSTKTGPIPTVEVEESTIVIAAEELEPPVEPAVSRVPTVDQQPAVSGELSVPDATDDSRSTQPVAAIPTDDEASIPVLIHDPRQAESAPILLDRRRPSDQPTQTAVAPTPASTPPPPAAPSPPILPDDDEVVVLDAKKPKPARAERRTQIGVGASPATTRAKHDTDLVGIPADAMDDQPTGSRSIADADPTKVDMAAAPEAEDYTPSDGGIAAPPSAAVIVDDDDDDDANIAPPPKPGLPPPSGQISLDGVVQRSPHLSDDDDDDDDRGPATSVMSAVELDEVIPERKADVVPAHLARRDGPVALNDTAEQRRIDYDPVDDGWGPPGTTIPPPLLGAIPGGEDRDSGVIPMPNMESAPLMVASPAPPEPSRGTTAETATGLSRALDDAVAHVLELIRALETARDRDGVVALMIAHLSETHMRAGFFAVRAGELSLFAMSPRTAASSAASLRLDRPSTLQDVVGTRLPYRGPMLDDASRTFLAAVLGACPPEILLVPVSVRERVVGVLFGEHRLRHTFDDQLALAARAAGNALERILIAKRV
jgi:hypothetical protein